MPATSRGLLIVYLSHPLGTSNGEDMVRRHDNISNSLKWYRCLAENTHWAIVMPWFEAIAAGVSELHRPKCHVNHLRVLGRCDALVMAGGPASPHMFVDQKKAIDHDLGVMDITLWGREPPATPDDEFLARLFAKMDEALAFADHY